MAGAPRIGGIACPDRRGLAFVGAQHALPGKHAWRDVNHPPGGFPAACPGVLLAFTAQCHVILSEVRRAFLTFPRFLRARERSRRTSLRSPIRPVAGNCAPVFFFVGAQHAVPGADAWRDVNYPPGDSLPLLWSAGATGNC